MSEKKYNVALTNWNGVHGLPDYSAFKDEDFKVAFTVALESAKEEIEALAKDLAPPTIESFLIPFELSGQALDRFCSIFFQRSGAHSNALIQNLEQEFAPALSRYGSSIMMDGRLFQKINHLYQNREKLTQDEQTRRVIELHWKAFTRNGARLDEQGKKRLAEINERLAVLGATFGQHVLKDEAEWVLFLKEDDLDGLPDDLKSVMREIAQEKGRRGEYALTLARSVVEPFLAKSARRDLREIAFVAWSKRGENSNDNDNRTIIKETVALRDEKAKLLGYESFAAFKLDNTMAKKPKAVMDLLLPVWEKARKKANAEEAALKAQAMEEGMNEAFKAWDWRYYAEKLRQNRFAFDAAELKPYLQLDQIIAAAFDCATRLFGITFEEKKGVPLWHEDARLFEVKSPDGSLQGLFIGDYFARASKRSGAWMSALQSQHRLNGEKQIPIIYNICNFAKPPKGEPALLSLDDARTLFHEFGHALHGLLSDVTWPSVSGTSVARDFVELPSQLYEHWLTVPEVLQKFALHAKTGEAMPQALLEKVKAAQTFNSGFETVEFTSSALIDMAFHQGGVVGDVSRFEKDELEKLHMPDTIIMRHRPPHFTHVFSGDGYSAGYYSYLWSEVLDADAFEAFEETGDSFHPALADKLKTYIYSAGGSRDPEELYKAFRGKMPTAEAMIKGRGL